MDTARGTPAPVTPTFGTIVTAGPAATPPAVLWAAPPNPMELTVVAGLQPAVREHVDVHSHAHLDIFVDGKPIGVPSGIGIDITSPDVHSFADPDGTIGYGGIQECGKPCISPLHTHAWTGILHTEAPSAIQNTLGEFFIEWDVALTPTCVGALCSPEKPIAVYLNGEPYTGDPAAIALTDQLEIAIVIGTPPAEIPRTSDFSRD
jgi:hypothetical protein